MISPNEKRAFLINLLDLSTKAENTEEVQKLLQSFLVQDTGTGKLYKYRAVDEKGYSLDCLVNNTLYCAEPSSFNDPFDCKIGITFSSIFEAAFQKEFQVVETILTKYIEVVRNKDGGIFLSPEEQRIIGKLQENDLLTKFVIEFGSTPVSEDDQIRILAENAEALFEMLRIILLDEYFSESLQFGARNMPYILENMTQEAILRLASDDSSFSDFANANGICDDTDELDLAIKMGEKFYPEEKDAIEKMQYSFQQLETNVVQKLMGLFRIGCLSANHKSPLMWSHYADSHRGFCVEYDFGVPDQSTLSLLPLPVLYSQDRPLVPWYVAFNNTPESAMAANKEILLGLLTKDSSWEYEKEWRLLIDAKQPALCQMPKITCVYLGACISEANRERIISIAMEKHFAVKQMTVDRGTYALHERTVDLYGVTNLSNGEMVFQMC